MDIIDQILNNVNYVNKHVQNVIAKHNVHNVMYNIIDIYQMEIVYVLMDINKKMEIKYVVKKLVY